MPREAVFTVLTGSLAIALVLSASAQQQPPIKPSTPGTVAPPTWSRVMNMPDGRVFVTDGALLIDARFAKPVTLPTVVLPPETAKTYAERMVAPHDNEIAFSALALGPVKNSFVTPDGIGLNGNYVNFLRQAVPVARTRLRTKGPREPVIVLTDGQPVAIVMPMVLPPK